MQRDHVHVAFDHDELALVEGRLPRPGEVEHGGALVEQLGLRRVQIFRLGAGSSARAPKAMTRPRDIENRDGEPVAEAIVVGAAVIGLDEEPGIQQLRLSESAFDESPFQHVLRIRCEADAELLHRLRREPAASRHSRALRGHRASRAAPRNRRAPPRAHRKAQAFLRRALVLRVWLRQRQASLVREPLNRFRKAQALGVHDEAENVAVLA